MNDQPGMTHPDACGPEQVCESGAARSTVRLLVDATVGPYFASKLLASMGIWIYNVVAAIVVYDVSRSALLVGAVSIVMFTPQVLLSPWMGAIADRGNRRSQLVAGRMMTGAGALALALCFVVAGDMSWIPFAVIASALVVGVGFAVSVPAMHAITPALARPSELPLVVAIAQSPMTLARAAGPAVGAVLLLSGGAAVAFAVAGFAQLVFAVVVLRLRLREVARPKARDESIMGGFRYVRDHKEVMILLVAVCSVGFGLDPVITLSPAIADDFGRGAQLVAWMASSFGIGAGLTVFFVGRLGALYGHPKMVTLGLMIMAGSLMMLAFSPAPVFALVALFLGGMGMIVAITSLTTQIQRSIPEALRGRIMAIWAICWVGSRPIAAGLNGSIADLWTPVYALLLSAVVLVCTAVMTRPLRVQRMLTT